MFVVVAFLMPVAFHRPVELPIGIRPVPEARQNPGLARSGSRTITNGAITGTRDCRNRGAGLRLALGGRQTDPPVSLC